ncbi:MAG: VWA domain-containing protein [Chitinophagales bacterium]|nr:VWA domain-containing protein [Chitinophagales bacterium]MCB9021073.1 VWA domain-containing protein [Chitinophagales bacterium]HPE98151.1 VWA domain-containing protein [Chitinophagales bacterium]HRX24150.1 VWA domain-containing protein [Chitinophagales bacterium]
MREWISDIAFADPWYFLLLLVIPLYLFLRKKWLRRTRVPFMISTGAGVHTGTWRTRFIWIPEALRMLAIASAVIALARPQTGFSNRNVTTEGIDIVMALDISSSMYAIDFQPNRITAAKEAAKEFIDNRPNDRIGLVVFAGETFTQCPITLDHLLLKTLVDDADNWQLEDGTAMGDGLFMAVNRLADTTQLNTKVVILLTDGVRTAGEFSPLDAANAAAQLNIRVYTIGVGSKSNAPIPVVDKNGRNIYDLDPRISFDEESLQQIADITGGQYFRATSKEKLKEVYREIDSIEKQKVEVSVTRRYDERFHIFALIAIIALMFELLLRFTIFKSLN